jgi:hypothetical protein
MSQRDHLNKMRRDDLLFLFGYFQDSVAQLVEQLTLNQWVASSNLAGVTFRYKATQSGGLFCLVNIDCSQIGTTKRK